MMWNTFVFTIFLFSHRGAAFIRGVWEDPNLPGVTLKQACHKLDCKGHWGNAIPNGQQWIQDGTMSKSGCCGMFGGKCDRCLDPAGVEKLTKTTTCYVQDNKLKGKVDGKCIASGCANLAEGSVVHSPSLGKVYVYLGGTMRHVPSCEMCGRNYCDSANWSANDDCVENFPSGTVFSCNEQCPASTIVGLVLSTQRGPGLVGGCCREDLNRGAGGDDIFLHANRNNGESFRQYGAISDLRLTNGRCEVGYKKLTTCCDGGDLNNNAGGDYIYLCYKEARGFGSYVVDLRLTTSSTCNGGANGWEKVVGSRDGGELNNNAGGEDIYLCMQKTTCLAEDNRRKQ